MQFALAMILATQAQAEKQIQRPLLPLDAVKVCLADLSETNLDPSFFRYVFIKSGSEDHAIAVDFVMNAVLSRSPNPIRGLRLGGGMVLRYDLTLLAPETKDLESLVKTWEELAKTEPYFLTDSQEVLFQKDVIVIISENAQAVTSSKALGNLPVGSEHDLLGEQTDNQGEWFKIRYQGQEAFVLKSRAKKQTKKSDEKEVIRTMGLHVGTEAAGIALATKTAVPIVRHDWFLRMVLSTLDGGLYYEFRGIVESPDESVSDLEHFVFTFGGIKIQTIEELRRDQKVAMGRSDVTGKPRAVWILTGIRRATVNQGLILLTLDMNDADVDPLANPLENLLKNKFAGIELFLELPNGMIAYALFTGDLNGDGKFDPKANEGNLVRVVPDTIASDHEIPAPHTRRLQPGISCIRCHSKIRGEEEPEGWIGLRNDVALLPQGDVNIFGERTDGKPLQDTIDRLAGLYSGDFSNGSKVIRRARDDFAEAMLRISGKPVLDGSIVTKVQTDVSKVYNQYWFELVTPQIACEELGVSVKDETEALAMLKKILPPPPVDKFGIAREDGNIAFLKRGVGMVRFLWEPLYARTALRAVNAMRENP